MSVRIVPISAPPVVSVPEPEIVLELGSAPETASVDSHVILAGKFLWVGEEKLYVRGVTYGTFRPGMDGSAFPSPKVVEHDFSLMSANGVNAVRTYTPPPHWLLEIALKCNLRVLVGMQGERHYTFLHEKKMVREIRKQVRGAARACAGHPAVLGYLVANEIPASIVRWHGASAVEKFVKQLRDEVKEEDPEALVSYANYPSTEYLDLSFLDLVCFNVFLESQDKYDAYLARLQNLAGNRPLLVTEIGLDSHRNGEKAQSDCLDWQVRKAFEEVPFVSQEAWPKISVVVCTFNGSRTIRDCLEGIGKLRYPNYETIVVDDGSTDGAGDIAAEYDVRLIRTENQGLSAARNLGWQSAAGEIVAYIDDDARPDPDWLTYLAAAFLKEDYAGVGGPNMPVPGDGNTANCVANSPDGAGVLETTDELRQGRGHAREKVAGKVQFRWLCNVGRAHICERNIPPTFVVSRADLSGNLGNSRLCATVPACSEPSELPATDARVAAHESCVGGALCREHVLGTSAGRFTRSSSCFRVVACPGNKRGVENPLSFVDERPLYSLSSARSYGTASPNAASNSPVEPTGLFPHGLENPPFSNPLIPLAADVPALE